MCYVACIALYEEGKSLEEITCPCGHGYWDIFEERFISGEQVREGKAPSRAEYEELVRQNFDRPEEYVARMREQYIIHFRDCDVKKARQEAVKQEGGIIDTSTAERSARELEEIRRGDFTSQGLSDPDPTSAAELVSADEQISAIEVALKESEHSPSQEPASEIIVEEEGDNPPVPGAWIGD